MKRKFSLAAILLTAALFAGCSFGGSVDLLLSPPRLSEEQSAVYDALIRSVGKEVKLHYPRAGEYRSAFVFANIDSEPDDEAVVFYEKSGESEGGGNVRINIIDRIDGKWTSVYDHAGAGTGIDRIIFSDIGSSAASMIIGYTLISGEKSAAVYSYDDGRLYTEFTDSYSNMFVTDISKDGTADLVLIRPENQLRKAAMTLVSGRTDDGSFKEIASVALDRDASEFVNIASGYVGTDTPAIFIDGLSSGQVSTEIIYSVNGQLRNPLYLGESALIGNTKRPAGYLCTDIDIDGIIEIPTISPFPGYSQDQRDSIYSTNWNIFDNYSIVKKYSSYYSAANSYCFILPSRWDGVVTAKIDSATGDVVFYKFRIDLENSTTELMRIAAADASETPALLEDGYMLIKSNNNVNYLVKSPDIQDEPLVLTMTEISNNFYVMI
ncbi:MAG: hypothetical protein J1F11_04760 [Oscillospiraceae bacterium]|nr:hypothetical protein [Oscillospiraceae bacterium]